MNAILHFIRGQNVRSAALLSTLHGELLEVLVDADHPWNGRAVKDLQIPRGAIIAVLERKEEVLVPSGEMTVLTGDRLVLFALPGTIDRLKPILRDDS
jgi:trk system potassium uptake protein TrkA